MFLALPLFHIFGLNVTIGLIAMNGRRVFSSTASSPIPALRRSRITRSPSCSVRRRCTPHGSRLPARISTTCPPSGWRSRVQPRCRRTCCRDFQDLFGVDIYEGYGLTETAPTLTSNRMTHAVRPGSVGLPLPEVELRIVDETGKDVEVGDPGEIIVRGPNVFKGYWQREEETAARSWTVGSAPAMSDCATKRDTSIWSIASVTSSSCPASTFSRPRWSPLSSRTPRSRKPRSSAFLIAYTGEAVKAFVVLAPGVDASTAELITDVQERLARFKRPDEVQIVENLPHR